MPDISMCANGKCPTAQRCYRFRAVPSDVQSYAAFEPGVGGCEWFEPIQPGRPIRTIEQIAKANLCLDVTPKVEV